MEQDVRGSMVGHIGAAPIPSCSQNRRASNPHSCPILTKNYVKLITWDARTDSNCDFAYIRCSLGYKPSVLTIERRAHNFYFIKLVVLPDSAPRFSDRKSDFLLLEDRTKKLVSETGLQPVRLYRQ